MPYKDPQRAKEQGRKYRETHRQERNAYERNRKRNFYATKHTEFINKIQNGGLPVCIAVTDDFGYWFSGLFDGEGCLIANRDKRGSLHLGVQIVSRVDDLPMLQYIQSILGGTLNPCTPVPPSRPKVGWFLTGGIKTLVEVGLPLFDKYPLHSKKQLEYVIWKQLLLMYYMATLGGVANPNCITMLPNRAEFNLASNKLCNEIHAIRFPPDLQPFKKGQTNE
jgi:hypothetical protein